MSRYRRNSSRGDQLLHDLSHLRMIFDRLAHVSWRHKTQIHKLFDQAEAIYLDVDMSLQSLFDRTHRVSSFTMYARSYRLYDNPVTILDLMSNPHLTEFLQKIICHGALDEVEVELKDHLDDRIIVNKYRSFHTKASRPFRRGTTGIGDFETRQPIKEAGMLVAQVAAMEYVLRLVKQPAVIAMHPYVVKDVVKIMASYPTVVQEAKKLGVLPSFLKGKV